MGERDNICSAIADEIESVAEEQGPIFADEEMAIAVAKAIKRGVAKVIRGKVIWEREGKIAHASPFKPKVGCAGDTITLHWLGFEGQYIITPHWFGFKGQWIRIVVEDINDQQGPQEGHPAGD